MKKHGYKKGERGMGAAVLFGGLRSLAMLAALSLIGALILSRGSDPATAVGAASLASLLLTGAISAFVTARRNGAGGFKAALLAALAFSAIMIAVSLIGNGKITGGALMNALCYLLISLLFAFAATRKKAARRGRR